MAIDIENPGANEAELKQALKNLVLPEVMHVEDRQTSGTAGQGLSSGSWVTRTLNNVVTNTITGASLSSNTVTLPAGTYKISGYSLGHRVNQCQARLYNVSDSAAALIGINGLADNGADGSDFVSIFEGFLTLAASKNFRIEMQVQTTNTTNGGGAAASFGPEIYSLLVIEKLA